MSKSEINETFKVFSALLEERKSELMRELDGMYTSKQVAMSVYSQKAQEVVDKIFQVRLVNLNVVTHHLFLNQIKSCT